MATSTSLPAQLEGATSELTAAIAILAEAWRPSTTATDAAAAAPAATATTPQLPLPVQAPASTTASSDIYRARRTVLASIGKLQQLLCEPADFIQQLSVQNQLLACVQWLGEFQVLVCIPLSGSVSSSDVAELTGVPETQLCRVVRMTATAGFLCEPKPRHLAHTALSASFITKPSFLDAAMFLAETAAPAALNMAAATHRFGNSQRTHESAYNIAFKTSATFATVCEQRAKLRRQWLAYLRYGMGDADASITDILTRLDWDSLGSASVAEVDAQSTAIADALATLHPNLHLIVQMSELGSNAAGHVRQQSISSRKSLPTPLCLDGTPTAGTAILMPGDMQQQLVSSITVQQRTPGTLQSISNAAVYIIHLPLPMPGVPSYTLPAQILAELRAHVPVLRSNTSAVLVLLARLLPEPGTVDSHVESIVRLRNLTLNQLANEQEIETLDVMEIINSVRDSIGRLVLVNKRRSRDNATIAFEVRYQAYAHSFG